jgi:hypothetical protein
MFCFVCVVDVLIRTYEENIAISFHVILYLFFDCPQDPDIFPHFRTYG